MFQNLSEILKRLKKPPKKSIEREREELKGIKMELEEKTFMESEDV